MGPRNRLNSMESSDSNTFSCKCSDCGNCEIPQIDGEKVCNNSFLIVPLQFPNGNVSALLDSGSSVNLMSRSCIMLFPVKINLYYQLYPMIKFWIIIKQANSMGNLCPCLILFELLKMSKLTRGPLVLYHLPKY